MAAGGGTGAAGVGGAGGVTSFGGAAGAAAGAFGGGGGTCACGGLPFVATGALRLVNNQVNSAPTITTTNSQSHHCIRDFPSSQIENYSAE
ncbi:MAG: hypothetical protein JWR35_524 [Marmoricola sp.]|nr:hypothetical protein [Marmoricola sp.]